jgi:Fe-S cluster biogenesis protein NfuA
MPRTEQDLRATGDRIERLLEELQATAETRSRHLAEELLRSVTELYEAGLARIVELANDADPGLITTLAADDLVASLLLVHGLHPESLVARVQGALEHVRPMLGAHAGDVELLGVDADAGAVSLRLLGSCEGCPSSAVTLKSAVERAIVEAAPEIVRVDVVEPSTTAASVQVAMRSKAVYDACPSEAVGA